ncbi:hypothetical protein DMENIID0001_148270 [Sergentomyia squamirostris]
MSTTRRCSESISEEASDSILDGKLHHHHRFAYQLFKRQYSEPHPSGRMWRLTVTLSLSGRRGETGMLVWVVDVPVGCALGRR